MVVTHLILAAALLAASGPVPQQGAVRCELRASGWVDGKPLNPPIVTDIKPELAGWLILAMEEGRGVKSIKSTGGEEWTTTVKRDGDEVTYRLRIWYGPVRGKL